jgi:hypothetical protein
MTTPTPEPTVFDAWVNYGLPWQPLGALHDAWRWNDAASAALAATAEWQQALWQSWWDAQAQWLAQCGGAWLTQMPVARGGEQLA